LQSEQLGFKDYDLSIAAMIAQLDYPFIWESQNWNKIINCGKGSLLLVYDLSEKQQCLEVWPEYWSKRFTASIKWGDAVSLECDNK
jgi:hypothetical protein